MPDQQAPQVDIANYSKQKELGNAKIVKIDGVVHLRMVPEKPVPVLAALSAEAITAGIKQKEEQKLAIDAEIETLKGILSDIENAKEIGA